MHEGREKVDKKESDNSPIYLNKIFDGDIPKKDPSTDSNNSDDEN